jgi:hypothetical protein
MVAAISQALAPHASGVGLEDEGVALPPRAG